MLRLNMNDLAYGKGLKTGLPKPLAGGLQLNTPEVPVCANGRERHTRVELSYALARGCVRILDSDLAGLEVLGQGSSAKGLHLTLSNGKSDAWVLAEETPSGKVLSLRGMPFSSQLVNYNAALAIGLFMVLQKERYYAFTSAAGKAVVSKKASNEAEYAKAVALMADELHLAISKILDASDPIGLTAVLLDRAKPTETYSIMPGGDELKSAFADASAFRRLAGVEPAIVTATSEQGPSFLGDLPAKIQDCVMRGKHILLTGPTGTGKTMAAEEACIALGAPMTLVKGSEGLEDRDLVGSTIIETENSGDGSIASKTRFTYGPVCDALMLGRRQYEKHLCELDDARRENREPGLVPPSVLLVDEINRLQTRHQNFLVSMLNVRRATSDFCLRIPDTNQELSCPEGFFVMIGARNVGGAFAGTNVMDLALERRFYKKLDVRYLPPEQEAVLLRSRTGLDNQIAKVLVKVAADSRYQLSQLKAPIDTDTLLKWAQEIDWLKSNGSTITEQIALDVARDVVFDIAVERSERGTYDPAGEAVLTDNISESWKDTFAG